jgi:hypothetical protein
MTQKILVAVHGIGDQIRCETIQAVAYQLCRYCGQPANIPLGRFNAGVGFNTGLVKQPGDDAQALSAFLVQSPPDPGLPAGVGFAEVYWADIPRGPAADRYTYEESKKWARTVVERVRAQDRARQTAPVRSDQDYELAGTVLEEMIDTVRVLQNLLFLAEKASVFHFDLNRLLVDYLGDVQVVADFKNQRERIVNLFQAIMAKIHRDFPSAELYVIAHSEGTVISFLGVLEALCRLNSYKAAGDDDPRRPDWVKLVRGFMTIGCPINKHLMLWPELWTGLTNSSGQHCDPKIQWRNYYDLGDPIGFRLDRTRVWLEENQWQSCFDFDGQKDDIGFTRYYFAGEAHNEYWRDEGVFGHFFESVVQIPPKAHLQGKPKYPAPRTRFWPQLVSPTLPFVLAAALLCLGVDILYQTVVAYCLPFTEEIWEIGRNVAGISLLLAGVTAAVRIPRLIKPLGRAAWCWRGAAFLAFVIGILAFPLLLTDSAKDRLGSVFLIFGRFPGWDPILHELNAAAQKLPAFLGIDKGTTLGLLAITIFAVVIIYFISLWKPLWRSRPLILLGTAVIVGIVALRIWHPETYDLYAAAKVALSGEPGFAAERLDQASVDVVNRYATTQNRPMDFKEFMKAQKHALVEDPKYQERRQAEGGVPEARLQAVGQVAEKRPGPIWPVLLAGAAFLYLWWLATLFFDLVVVWHYYIRQSAILDRLAGCSQRHPVPANGGDQSHERP